MATKVAAKKKTKAKAKTAEGAEKRKKKTVKKAAADGEEVVKKVKKKRVTKAEREAIEEAERLRDKWQELHSLSEGQPAKKYKITDSYESNSSLDHAKLGWGYVLTSQNNRLEVLFEDGIKILIQTTKDLKSYGKRRLAQLEGKITDAGAGGLYQVELENGAKIKAKLCGKMRRFNIRVVVGDKVTVGVSPYDPTHGLIMYRHK